MKLRGKMVIIVHVKLFLWGTHEHEHLIHEYFHVKNFPIYGS